MGAIKLSIATLRALASCVSTNQHSQTSGPGAEQQPVTATEAQLEAPDPEVDVPISNHFLGVDGSSASKNFFLRVFQGCEFQGLSKSPWIL
jgi:hypothetical protein